MQRQGGGGGIFPGGTLKLRSPTGSPTGSPTVNPMQRSTGSRNLMPVQDSQAESDYNSAIDLYPGSSAARAVIYHINNNPKLFEFDQPRITELIEYAKTKGVNFEGLTIPVAATKVPGTLYGTKVTGAWLKGGRKSRKSRTRKSRTRKSRSRG